MLMPSVEEFDALTRIDFWIYVQRVFVELTGENFDDNFHIQLLCAEIDRARTESSIRLAVALPPRSLKSIIISVAFSTWLLGHDAGIEVVCVSYGQELSDKLATDARRIMLTPWYRRLFPKTVLDRQAISHLATTSGGKRYATSVGGPLTGIGADVIIVDDPMKPNEALSEVERGKANDWARHTLFTRLNNKAKDRIIIVQQRLHEDDMIGHVIDRAGFKLLSFPAIAQEDERHVIRTPFGKLVHCRLAGEALHPSREPLSVLARQSELLGSFFSPQYLQLPTPPGGGLIKLAWFNEFDLATKPRLTKIIQSWDCASKATQLADYSVCTTWGVDQSSQLFLIHVFRERLDYPDLKRKVRELAILHNAGTVLIEDAAAGIQLIQELKLEGLVRIVPIKPKGDKVIRMTIQTPIIEAGRVFLPKSAPWRETYLHELMAFPKNRYFDQVDSTSQALAFIGMQNDFSRFIEMLYHRSLETFGLTPNDLTVTFECDAPGRAFFGIGGRGVHRHLDGLYHVTANEWQVIKHNQGVTIVDDRPGP